MTNIALTSEMVDYGLLKSNYPWIEFIGLVGFDTKRQKFIMVEAKTSPTNIPNNINLSNREQEVLQLVVMGNTNAQIARKLTIAESTVKGHLKKIFTKLKVQSRTEAAIYAIWHGWVIGK